MAAFERPGNPEYLRQATFRMFGERCLRCGESRPLEMAHIANWPKCVILAGEKIDGVAPPDEWHYGAAVGHFHHLGNVLPLCANCHTLYDGEQYTDVTESEIRDYRDAAVRQPDVLARLIDFVGTELSGRPGRCTHKVDGKRKHSHAVDAEACAWPLMWISQGYEQGLVTDDPNMIVLLRDSGFHYHVPLTTTEISMCSGELSECGRGVRIWKRSRAHRSSA
ncbi:HNH endonuclease [Streptomyces sp. NPDC050804]|uniref:HNH endonuclease n=1 Tax=Streptomyces sp. NPDC050804 TaxID=3154745 RepID=UPI00342FAFD9